MGLKSYLKISVFFLFFLGLAFTWSCKEAQEEELSDPIPVEREESPDELDVNVNVNVVNPPSAPEKDEESEEHEEEETEKQGDSTTIIADSILILNINQTKLDNYELWECRKTNLVISYFLNKSPDTVDDEGTPKQRKRVCELFKIKTVKDNQPEIKILNWAHYQKDWCEKKLNETLTLNESRDEKRGGFECKKFGDLSFLFIEE